MSRTVAHPALKLLDAQSAPPLSGKPNLLGYELGELEAFCDDIGEKRFRAKQIFTQVFARRTVGFDEMTDISKTFRARLEESFSLSRPTADKIEVSTDGTRKYRFLGEDGTAFEAVYIPAVARKGKTNTLCVSSQTGCAVGCRFCYTASLRRNRNLSAAEIVGQVLAVRDDVAELGDGAKVTNIVYMGMGEPLLNYDEVVRSVRLLTHELGCNFSTRRVTVSTSGIVPRIYQLGEDVGCQLAISLNATTNAVRDEVMPINKKWPLEELLAALKAYPLANRRRITIEYVLLKDVNDTDDDARRLVKLLEGIPTKINLLPLNAHDRTDYETPTAKRVEAFQDILHRLKANAICRTPRGRDIAAACGQLGESVVAAAS